MDESHSLLREKTMMVKIFFTLATAALVLGAPAPGNRKVLDKQGMNMMKLDADRPQNTERLVLAPVSPSKYRPEDVAEKRSKLKKRSVFDDLDDQKMPDTPGFLSHQL